MRAGEQGFTLVELIVSIVLLALITGGLAAAFVTSLNATRGTEQRVKATNDAQIIAGFLTRDAQAAGGTDPATGLADPSLGVKTPGTITPAQQAECTTSGSLIMRFKWVDRSPTTDTPTIAAYSYSAGAQQILRTVCVNGNPSGTQHTLARNVVSTGSPQSPFGWCNGTEGAACPNFPNTVTLRFTETNTLNSAAAPYTYVLSASLRPQSNAAPEFGNQNAAAPMLLLGGGSGCPGGPSAGLTGTGNPTLTVYGIGTINGCPASTLTGSSSAGSTGGTYVVAPATCSGINPPCTVVSGKFADPYASLISNGTLSPPSTAGCTGGPNPAPVAGHYSPGTFPLALNASNVTFDAGTYVFCGALNIGGTVVGNNVTFYFANCATCTVNVGNNASFTLTKPTSGPYASYGLTLWEAQGNTAAPTSGTSNNIVVNIFGTVYTPSARVSFKNGTVHIDQVVAVGMDLPGGTGGTTIGDVPVITSTSPNTRGQGAANQNITINGANFEAGGSLASDFGAGITVNSTTFVDSSHLTANISVAGNATIGPRDVTVTNGNGRTGTKTAAFNVSQGPGVASATPNSKARGLTNQNIVIAGSNFVNGAQATFSGAGITVNSTTFNNANQVTANVDIAANATLGSSNVTVTNPDGGRATANNAFFVVAPTIVSVTLANGPNPNVAGTIERNDTITIVFSSQMRVSDICSTWSNDNNNQNLNQNGDVVTVTDGGVGNDSISFSATACTLGVGTINLGSTLFVTGGNAAFGTNGNGNRSVFAWNAATHTLTITLGVKAGAGTLVNVPGNVTPVYTAGSIHDSGGASLTNSPFTLPSGKQF